MVTNPSHIIEDFTTTANTTVTPYTVRTPCGWFAVQNKSDTDIYIKTVATNTSANAILIPAGAYKLVGGMVGQANGYDLNEYGVFCTASGKTYTIERKVC
jgi:hypothetical protein